MISTILGARPHVCRAAHAPRQDAVSQILRLAAHLAAARLPIDLAELYGGEAECATHREPSSARQHELVIPVGTRAVVREQPVFAAEAPIPEPVAPKPITREQPVPEPVAPKPITREQPVPEPVAPKPITREQPIPEPVAPKPITREQPVPEPVAPKPITREQPVPEPVAPKPITREQPIPEPVAPNPITREQPIPASAIHEASNRPAPPLVATPAPAAPVVVRRPVTPVAPLIEAVSDVQVLNMQAQETFLRLSSKLLDSTAAVLRFQTTLLRAWIQGGAARKPLVSSAVPRTLTYEQCCAFAAGAAADALGPLFAEVDTYPTRVRLPDGPLQLVDRITLIEGEPKSMTAGRVVTDHAVRADRWYLENGRIPTAIAVESGQADLFLSGYLGIDFQTRGRAVYRLLDAVVAFHRALPTVGETIVYDIHIDRFVKQGEAWLFHFRFDGTVNGEPFITMRNGVAGFFSHETLAAGKGIVQTTLDKERRPGRAPEGGAAFVRLGQGALSTAQVDALRGGDLVAAFGSEFARAAVRAPCTIPGGMLRLIDRVPLVDPQGGRFGVGFVRAEFDIHPDDWFLTCHFVDDMVMPGTLMYECCLHTLRILLLRLGWVGAGGAVVCEPVPAINSRLKCRGQVTASTKTVAYEVTVKELGFRPEPYCLADALMYADGKPIVEITNMSLRMSGLDRPALQAIWGSSPAHSTDEPWRTPLYDRDRIMAYSNGNPSEAFGEPYRVFDIGRVLARLPGPPYQFLDCITAVDGAPFVLKAGARCEAEYAVPPDAWYFAANRSANMPFSVLLEIALQPCGWLAAYCGSALTSSEDLSFRNLGGKATLLRPVTPASGTLTTSVKMTSVSNSAGMIIQHYEMLVSDGSGEVYKGTTYFGFFTKPALANQIGIRDAKVPWPSDAERIRAESATLPHDAPFPTKMLRMVDRITTYLPDGGSKGLGLVVGAIDVDPGFWFFKAHFYQDPVWPGSLGLESFLQLLKFAAWKRWGEPDRPWQTVALAAPHTWVYRGQVLPTDREVTVVLEIVAADDHNHRLTANGFLTVDGRIIYQMTDFTLE
jgi:3-hydroxymyristoyl/3-hydroxydecanoyl-(acyl carrier protein) dehydratase